MRGITDELFVGNKLTKGTIQTSDRRIDLRNIRAPIVVIASWGDNITPPPQALNWIPDLYESVDEIRAYEQVIVYTLDQRIGHLGIFVSANLRRLEGRKGLVIGVANQNSIAYGCARAFHSFGAELAITYLNDKARPYVEPLAAELEAPIFMPLDVQAAGQMEAVFGEVERRWGRLDFALHSIAFAPRADLHGRVVDCSREGFLLAMDVSCHSFIRMARLAEPLMTNGGALFTMSYFGAERVVENYNLMGPVKAALEAAARYLAAELGPQGIRVHAISPGPLKTRAASGIAQFDELLDKAAARAPARRLVTIEDVGFAVAGLATDAAKLITGDTIYIDGGFHIMG